MIRNHPYVKIVGISIANCLQECFGQHEHAFDDRVLEKMVSEGIDLYERYKEKIESAPTLEHRRQRLCELFKPSMEKLLPALA